LTVKVTMNQSRLVSVSLVQLVNTTEVHFLLEAELELSNLGISFTRMFVGR